VALTFPVIRARTADGAARLSSMALCVGYIIASIAPLVLGVLNRGADARLPSMIWLLFLVLLTMIAGSFAGRRRFIDD
jgi:cyanate permease